MTQQSAKDVKLLVNNDSDYFQVCINEFTSQAAGHFDIPCERVAAKKELLFKALRFCSRYIRVPRLKGKKEQKGASLSVTIGPDFAPVYNGGNDTRRYMYCFDCWPVNNAWVIEFSRIFNIKGIFFSAKQAADLFNKEKGNRTQTKGIWIPEGIKAADYKWYGYGERKTDVLEFGRRYGLYHDQIREPLKNAGYTHAYAEKGKLLFADESAFVEGLAQSKISICFPSSITHPERSGNISTMTLRYLQSMASKCLVVGKMPYDMQYLFDYIPVVEIDERDPGKQIVEILEHYEDYIPLIEKNYEQVVALHDWSCRIQSIITELSE